MQRRRSAETLTREDAIRALMRSMVYPAVDSPLLVTFPQEERAEMVAKALEREWDARQREREPILMERLATWPVDQWAGGVFCERPDLLESLTPAQRAAWDAFRSGHGNVAQSTIKNVLRMPEAR